MCVVINGFVTVQTQVRLTIQIVAFSGSMLCISNYNYKQQLFILLDNYVEYVLSHI